MSSIEENEHLLPPEVAVDSITEQEEEKQSCLQLKHFVENEQSEIQCLHANFSSHNKSEGTLYPGDNLIRNDINKCKSLDNIIAISSLISESTSRSTNCLAGSGKQTCCSNDPSSRTDVKLDINKKAKKQPRRNTCQSKKTLNNVLTNTTNVSRYCIQSIKTLFLTAHIVVHSI